ncbi:hypothetical protein pEaSNUABM5_00334 [Erwinia phage pEa_SNUABM_5]|uniref:Uncharacterized protein n=1 Tax=Erwinia phage pEa_SNUABM_5 TaxID=2797313 RepID=A0A7T8EPV9_9CAUD|nr:hypothetical protein MPK73_gp334 [Erwinia phage pEa_SNUABM_5]QQO90476.1 hypothetical protein pEaSNUABM5_00334 [Erwinia phage pEa_SNUABM_5]
MFYKELFSPEEHQTFLNLVGWRLIDSAVPKYLESSQHALKVRHSVIKYNRPSQITTPILPRIRTTTVMRLFRAIRDGNLGLPCAQLAALFDLGMGVPKQRDIAQYIRDYNPEHDPNGEALKSIRTMVVQYQRKVRRSLNNWQYLPPAEYVAQLLKMQRFIGLKENGYKKRLAVPDGIPVVLIYANSNVAEKEFTLVDAFMISALGYPVPFAQTALRKEFKAPKTFKSKALAGRSMYAMVMGIVYWPGEKAFKMMRMCRSLDIDDYTVLLDQFEDLQSKELRQASKHRMIDREHHEVMRTTVTKYEHRDDLTAKQAKRLAEAQEYFQQRRDALSQLDKLEKQAARELERTGPVASAHFCAVDAGTIVNRDQYLGVKNTLERTETILGGWGFETLSNAAVRDSEMTYIDGPKGRCWSL